MSTVPHNQARAQQAGNQLLSHPFAQQAMSVANGQLAQLDKQLSQFPVLNNLEAQTKVPKAYGVLALVGRLAESRPPVRNELTLDLFTTASSS